jgi:two-component system, LytTR family, sensor histidine kinase AgrC
MILLLCISMISILNIVATHALLTRIKSMKYCFIAYTINIAVFVLATICINTSIDDPVILKYIIYFLSFLTIIYIYLVFAESLSKKIFTMFSIWMFSTIILNMATIVMNIYSGTIEDNFSHFSMSYTLRICLQLLFLPFIYTKIKTPYKKVMEIIPDKTIHLMSVYPVISFIFLINNNEVTFGHRSDCGFAFNMLTLLALISLGYMLIFAGIASSSKVISLQYNYKIIENQVELQRQSYKKLSESNEMIYTLKHDTRHYIAAIKTMLVEENYSKALEYVEQFNQSERLKTIPALCDNFAADSIVRYYMSIALDKGIDFCVNANIPENLGINPLDLCVILGNCLENAIDACDRLEAPQKKQITLSAGPVRTHIVFKIANSFDGKLIRINNVIKSSKHEPGHGIGLSSIHETVNRYNGNVDYNCTEESFEIVIMMCHAL